MSKRWWQSRTLWFNAVATFILLMTEIDALLALYPVESPLVDQVQLWLPFIMAGGNAWLRIVTSKSVTL